MNNPQYAIKNDKGEYLKVWNVDFRAKHVSGYFTNDTPIQVSTSRESVEKVLAIVQSNGHKAEMVEVSDEQA